MSGHDAIRGFMFQTITSVLSSLSDSDWTYMTVEPNTPNDKVDILWEYADNSRKCQQVKSSVHNFSKPDILRWLGAMVTDGPAAKRYELTLIGDRNNDLGEFIQKLNKGELADLGLVLQPYADRLHVETLTFSVEMFRRTVQDHVNQFLSQSELTVKHDTLVLITSGLISQFFEFAAFQIKWTREQWRRDLLDWVTRNYKRSLGLDKRIDGLSVGIYIATTRTVIESSSALQYNIPVADWVSQYHDRAMGHFQDAAAIRLSPPPNSPGSHLYSQGFVTKAFTFPSQLKVTLSGPEENYLSSKVRQYFGRSAPEGFFHLGNLQQSVSRAPFEATRGIEGTGDERKKHTAIRSLQKTFILMDEFAATLNYLNSLYYLPLILVNNGSKHDEELVVTLTLPDRIDIMTARDFYQPRDLELLEACLKDEFVLSLLYLNGDSVVNPFPHTSVPRFEFKSDPLWSMLNPRSLEEQIQEQQNKLVTKIGDLLERELFEEDSYKKVRYHFPKINPNRKIAMPTYLFFHAETSFDIDYEILSKNTSAVQRGKMHCEITPRSH
ncbi:MAG TPA: hypothetical protein VGN00_16535 [Puia sp.]|jgi:hypothetical protein